MKLLMVSGDRSLLTGKRGAFFEMLGEFSKHWERIDIIMPRGEGRMAKKNGEARNQESGIRNQGSETRSQVPDLKEGVAHQEFPNVFLHPSPYGLLMQPYWIKTKGLELWNLHKHQTMTVHDYPPFYNGIGAWRLHRVTRIPYAVEIHHIVGMPIAASLHEWIGKWLSIIFLRFDAKRAKAVRVVNREVQTTLSTLGIPAEKIHLVPSFYLDHEKLSAIAESSVQKSYDLVAAARLAPNKGIDQLIKALPALPGKTLLIIGDGQARGSLESLAHQLGVSDRVAFTGWLPSAQDVWKGICSARVFVLPSLSEGGPRSALESMALGVPVLATKVGIMPEVIQDGDNGWFSTGTSDDLSQKLSLVLSQDLHAASKNAKASVTRFNRETLIGNYAQFLQSIA